MDDVQSNVDDVDSRVAELENFDPYEFDSRISDVESRVDDACSTLSLDLDTYGC